MKSNRIEITNHDKIGNALRLHVGETRTTAEIIRIVQDKVEGIPIGSILPNDHGAGNKSPCWCAGTDRRIFDRIKRGTYRIR